jgi:hypothetical protein
MRAREGQMRRMEGSGPEYVAEPLRHQLVCDQEQPPSIARGLIIDLLRPAELAEI